MHHSPHEHPIAQETNLEPRPRVRLRRAALVTAGILALSVAAAGCGGGPSTPGVAAGPTTTAVGSPPAGGTQATGLVAYASCMRSHGVPDFPDPTSSGIPKPAVVSAFQAVSSSASQAASSACRSLLPGGSLSAKPTQAVSVQDRPDYLRAAACMRSHGFPGFPDPTFQNNSVQVDIPSSIDQNSSQFMSAATVCTKLIPAGLPYTRPSGS